MIGRTAAHALAAALLAGTAGLGAAGCPSGAPVANVADVAIGRAVLAPLPAGLVGLSFESDSATGGLDSGRFDAGGNLPALLRTLGPGTMRFGGNSVDLGFHGASRAALAGVRRLADESGWQVRYSENLGHYDAAATAADAAAAAAALGPRLRALACGNEPNLYPGVLRREDFDIVAYLAEAMPCWRVLHRAAPGVPVAGPDAAPPVWQAAAAFAPSRPLAQLTAHYYPLTHCGRHPGNGGTLLSAATRDRQGQYFASVGATARAARLPWALTETNSASCSGIPGTSNTFAAALWSVDYALQAAEHGAQEVDFHTSVSPRCVPYTALCPTAPRHFAPRPLYYGLLLLRLLGPGELLPATLTDFRGPVTVHALRSADGAQRLVLENLGPDPVGIRTPAPAAGRTALGWRLAAPGGPTATTGVTVNGRTVAADGTFAAPPPLRVACAADACRLPLPGYSATVLVLPAGAAGQSKR
ncbi:hypothetical protein DN069_01685 [Streptacidiphilus pinicola]|uniref:Beta-glucuronidase C-terminal domain-containing protein n=1 Tax=Streptacidiphilus pinicola TaxID=2219663 RepID=A0A2X0IV39_9ACTN|nr:hypothetical protein [Streptacidiphilus pinicola]RAG87271.1 hypothetical protein DN069_01685 [Streptacidiphilus pinicola]